MTGAPPKPSDCQKPLPGAPVIGFSDLLGVVNRAIDAMRVTQRLFQLSDGHVLMTACKALTEAADKMERICPHCGNECDPDVCWCGDLIKQHGMGSGHNPVPMGCTCGYV